MFYYFEGRYKKLIFYSFETAKNWSFETAKNWIYETFLQATFLQFQNCKKIAYGNGDFIFHNFTATATATVWKSSFLQLKKNWLEVKKKCYFCHVFKTPFYAVLILPKNAVSKRQLCLRFETPDYNHKRTLLYA